MIVRVPLPLPVASFPRFHPVKQTQPQNPEFSRLFMYEAFLSDSFLCKR